MKHINNNWEIPLKLKRGLTEFINPAVLLQYKCVDAVLR
jgi:hypothetical protein